MQSQVKAFFSRCGGMWREPVLAYGVAIGASAGALLFRREMSPLLGHRPSVIMFILPIILSAYAGGLGPGLLATGLCSVGGHFLLAEASTSLMEPANLWNWGVLVAAGALISVLVETQHRTRREAERAGRLQTVTLASIGDGVVTTDAQGKVTFLNAEAERLTEWSSAEAQGHPLGEVFRIINERTRKAVEDPAGKVLGTGMVVGLANHTVLVGRKGKETPIDDSGAPIKDEKGVMGGVVVFRDCTEKKRAAEALQESQALYHSLVEQMPAGVFRKDLAGRYVFVNPLFCELRGAKPEQFLGKLPTQLPSIEGRLRKQGVEHHEEILRTGKRIEVLDEYHLADGRTLYFQVAKTPVFDAQGNIAGSQGVLLDATRRVQEARQLAESISLLRTTIESCHEGILAVNNQGRVTVYNQRFLEIWGIPEAVAQRGDDEAMLNLSKGQFADPEGFVQRVREHYTEPGTVSFETLLLRDGRIIERVSKPQILAGKNIGRVWSFRDVTERKNAEKAVRDRELLLRQVIDLVPHFIFAKSPEGMILFVNQAYAGACGLTVAEATGRNELDFGINTAQFEPYQRDDREVLASGRAKFIPEEPFWDKDGRLRYLETIKIPFQMPGQTGLAVLGVAVDITERKRLEADLRAAGERLRFYMNRMPLGFIAWDADWRVAEWNAAAEAIFGWTAAEAAGKRAFDLMVPPGGAENAERIRHELLEKGIFQEKLPAVTRDGRRITCEWRSAPWRNAAGEICGCLSLVSDITKGLLAEERLRQLAVIVESSEDAIMSSDLDGVLASWNRGAEVVFGYAAEEVLGKSSALLYPEELKDQQTALLERIARGESVEHFPTDRVRKEGKRVRVSATISPIRDAHGRVVGAATIARDITRQQLLEEQLRQAQKMEAIGQLAGGVAHDFNNVLAVIQMQVELCRMDGQFLGGQAACLDEIETAANRAANLTRQLLLFSRRQRLERRELDLSDSIAGMTKMLRRVLGEDIQIHFRYAPQPLYIHADASMMDQIVMNLTLNSRDAMPEGGQLVIETAAVEFDELAALQSAQARPGSFVRLMVRDTGCGIRREILPRIFEPFFTTKDVGKGTGLGLATVFSIVQQHEGWIHVVSEPGRGTTFNIYLPRLMMLSESSSAPAAPAAPMARGSESILLVEDDEALRESMHRCLAQLGYQLRAAANGAEALAAWQKRAGRMDLLLTDLRMPGEMKGRELADRLRRDQPDLKVIFVSGYEAEHIPGERAASFLAKPFAALALAQAVRDRLDGK